jgi:predicted MFS family arabinose efflux permease
VGRSALAPAGGAREASEDVPEPSSDRAEGTAPRRLALRLALVVGAFIGMVDATIVAVAAEPMARHFGITPAAAQQTLSVYLVTVTASVPLLGRLGDRLGRREAYLAGFAVFAAGSVLAALAPGFGVVLVARAVQAVGGGLLTAGSLALTAEHARPRAAGRAVATLVIAQAIAGLVGPPVGGALVALWGWQAVFWAGLPLAALGVAITLRAVPRSASGGRAARLDLPGAIGLAALLFGLGAGVASLAGPALGDWQAERWLLVAAGGGVLLTVAELRGSAPIIDRRWLGGRFGAATLATLLSTGSLMSCFALLPFWLENAHAASAAVAGVALLPIGIGIGLTSRRGGRLGDAGRTADTTAAGMLLAAVGFLITALAAAAYIPLLLPVGLLVLGCGNGLFSSANTAAALATAPRNALGGAAGFLSTARNAGVILGLGVTGAAYTAAIRGGQHRGDLAAGALFAGTSVICLAVALLAHRTYRPLRAAPVAAPPAGPVDLAAGG